MPVKYGQDCIDAVFQLYLRYNGQNFDRIEKEIRKTYPGWSKQNLFNRGNRIGWIDKYSWDRALKIKLATQDTALAESEIVADEIFKTRKTIKGWLDASGGTDKDLLYAHRDYCKLSIEALNKIDARRDNLEGFTVMGERLLDWLPSIDPKAAKALLAVWDQVIERATAEYGDDQGQTDSAGED